MVQKPATHHFKTIEARDIVKEFAHYYRDSEFMHQRVQDYNNWLYHNPQPAYVQNLIEPTVKEG